MNLISVTAPLDPKKTEKKKLKPKDLNKTKRLKQSNQSTIRPICWQAGRTKNLKTEIKIPNKPSRNK
jgi:hypothetical protein